MESDIQREILLAVTRYYNGYDQKQKLDFCFIKRTPTTEKQFTSIFNNLQGRFISYKVYDRAFKNVTCMWTSTHNIEGTMIFLTFLQETKNTALCKKMVHYLYTVCKALNLFTMKNSSEVYITLIDIDLPKHMVMENIPDNDNVNTGVKINNQIIVFRREEMVKVLIHELLHVLGFELLVWSKNAMYRSICQYFKVNDILINEAYVESLALFINTCLSCKGDTSKISKKWMNEIEHTMKMAMCVGMNYLTSLDPYSTIIHEKTNTYAYYVIKAMLLSSDDYWSLFSQGLISLSQSERDRERLSNEVLRIIIQQQNENSSFWNRLKGVPPNQCYSGMPMKMSVNSV